MKILSASGSTITIENACPFCKEVNQVTVETSEFRNWQRGVLIQDAMPSLSPSERELLMTGMCDDCFPSEEY